MANPAFTVDATNHDTNGYVRITFTNATKGTNWYSWRVKRRPAGASAWTLLKEYTVDQANYEYHDVTAPQNTAVDYSVTRVHLVGSVPTEEADTPQTNITAVGSFYWLIHPTDESKNLVLRNVNSDSYDDDYDTQVHRLIGRGRKADQSTNYGVDGTFSAQLQDITGGLSAAASLAKLHALKAANTYVYLKTPFGQVWKVALGKLSVSRVAGVGIKEFTDITVPYSEVA